MDRYIGLDAHASSCTLGVLGPGGKRLGSGQVPICVRMRRGSSSTLRLACLGDLLGLEQGEVQVAALAPDFGVRADPWERVDLSETAAGRAAMRPWTRPTGERPTHQLTSEDMSADGTRFEAATFSSRPLYREQARRSPGGRPIRGRRYLSAWPPTWAVRGTTMGARRSR